MTEETDQERKDRIKEEARRAIAAQSGDDDSEVVDDEAAETASPKAKNGLTPIVEITGVTRTFVSPTGEEFTAIKDVNLVIEDNPERGEMRAVLGPSGCGKSTLLNMVAGLDKPTTGTVKVEGKLIEGPGPDRGMVFQNYSSMPWMNVLQNVAYGLELRGMKRAERESRAADLIKQVGLSGHETKYPKDLSGGMRQRVAIARTLAVEPNIILMDEPFGALDVGTRVEMQDMLLRINEELEPTILFVTHDIGEAVYLADRIYIFSASPGTIVDTVEIDLPHDRTRDVKHSARFRKYESIILEKIHDLSEDSEFMMTV